MGGRGRKRCGGNPGDWKPPDGARFIGVEQFVANDQSTLGPGAVCDEFNRRVCANPLCTMQTPMLKHLRSAACRRDHSKVPQNTNAILSSHCGM
ncbi:hypothetical protein A3216_00870 [Mycobacterium leprae 7935681]|nr:hypothetical protein A3216_00870 [Mycobacterium leprae 7935681]